MLRRRTTTGYKIYVSLTSYLNDHDLSSKDCYGICKEGAPSMYRKHKGFTARSLNKNLFFIITHCLLHRETACAEELTVD